MINDENFFHSLLVLPEHLKIPDNGPIYDEDVTVFPFSYILCNKVRQIPFHVRSFSLVCTTKTQ